nr:nose resistant to fluoxetine protein 6 [Helicoverpa armigera]
MVLLTLVVLFASVVAGQDYTDEDRAHFPRLFHLDEYDRCLAKTDGVYCLGTFDLTPAKLPHPTYELMKKYSDESYRHFNRTRIHRGYCLSLRCPTSTLNVHNTTAVDFEVTDSIRFERCADFYAQKHDLRASLQTLHYCRTHVDAKTDKKPTAAERIFKQVIYALVLANVIGTIYDVFVEDGPNKNKLLSAFSIPANWRRLTYLPDGGDPRQTALVALDGVRVMALGFTTYAHASVFHYMFHTINPEYLEQLTQRWDGIILTDGTSLIQGFVMMSCFLTGYNLLMFSQKHELGIHLLPLCIIKRYIRITPVHLLIVGYGATWWLYTRDGPLVPTTIGLESEACKAKFWYHVFLLNNVVDSNNYCVVPTWFLPVNMHMYILACTMVLLFWRRRCFAVRLYTILLIASCLLTAVIAYMQEYKAMIYLSLPEQIRRIFRDTPSFTDFYLSSWGAIPSCFVGLILAHIQHEIDLKNVKLSDYKWFVYLHYGSFPLLFTWATTGFFMQGNYSPVFNAVYVAFDRPFYCILMAIGILGIIHIDGPIRRFYSWSGWRSMARMSLTVMMLHWCINMSIGTRPSAFGTSVLDTLVDWSATNLFTYAAAVPITIMVEYPMQRFLEKLLF